MTGKMVGFIALAAMELLASLSLYNQSLGIRAQITVHHRRSEAIEARLSEVAAARASFLAPSTVNQRLATNCELNPEL